MSNPEAHQTAQTNYLRYHGEVLNNRGNDIAQIEALSGGTWGTRRSKSAFVSRLSEAFRSG